MLTVHHLNNSRSQRVLWLLEELALPYEIARYQRHPRTMLAPPELRAIHPLGKSPVITDDNHVIAESGAILEYLLDKVPNTPLRPAPGSEDFLRYRYFLHYAEGSLMPLMVMALVMSAVSRRKMPFFVKPIANTIVEGINRAFLKPQIKTHLEFVDNELSVRPWFAGDDFSAADIQMSFALEGAAARMSVSGYPHISAFLARATARPAYRRALEKGGKYDLNSF
ncbi:MAG TPA: glutathione S-transferase [Polyangiales bacterium]